MENKKYKTIFGPVPSRRLGMSLGVNPIPLKTCNYSCIYCQLGRTKPLTNEIKEYIDVELIKRELKDFIKNYSGKLDYITVVGEGEPLLNSNLGELIKFIKKEFSYPLSLITNGSLFYINKMREAVYPVDVVMPTVDTVFEETFKKMNRPSPKLPELERILEGLLEFRKNYTKKLWVEVMLVKGFNDSEDEVKALSHYFKELLPDRVYINVPVRPPAEDFVKPPDPYVFSIIEKYIEGAIILNFSESGRIDPQAYPSLEELIVSISRRHPISFELLKKSIATDVDDIKAAIENLKKGKKIEIIDFSGKKFIRGIK